MTIRLTEVIHITLPSDAHMSPNIFLCPELTNNKMRDIMICEFKYNSKNSVIVSI